MNSWNILRRGGAYFQWAVNPNNAAANPLRRAAYNPARNPADNLATSWITGDFPMMWNPSSGTNFSQEFETCPPGYRRPTDGYVGQISYNGYYDHIPVDASDNVTNYGSQIAYSEIRVSLFETPYAGNANSVADYNSMNLDSSDDPGPGTFPEKVRSQLPGTIQAFYADGFFDRRPIVESESSTSTSKKYCVAPYTSYVAFPGVLFYNQYNHASLFFPGAGRIVNTRATRESMGSTGYYWSASAGPPYSDEKYGSRRIGHGAWNYEIGYYWMMPKLNYTDFANTIRCVKNDPYPETPTSVR
ncbi:MAG: hypothetical protein LUH22_14780 [Bacteroides sp.]|nr:hypothetical protein [Bacteroides sp.]